MLAPEYLDYLDITVREIRKIYDRAFGGIQVDAIVCVFFFWGGDERSKFTMRREMESKQTYPQPHAHTRNTHSSSIFANDVSLFMFNYTQTLNIIDVRLVSR